MTGITRMVMRSLSTWRPMSAALSRTFRETVVVSRGRHNRARAEAPLGEDRESTVSV
jgi:hypothetical protein